MCDLDKNAHSQPQLYFFHSFFVLREARRDFIKAKYEQHKFVINTCTDKEDLKQDLKQAILSNDLMSLLQVQAEGMDLSTTLPDMVNKITQYIKYMTKLVVCIYIYI
jgi:hypothetical protein